MPGDHRAVDGVRRLRDGARPRRRPEEGADRPLPLAADVARRGRHRDGSSPTSATNVIQLVVMFAVGLAGRLPFSTSPRGRSPGSPLLLLIGYAFSWVFAFIGLTASSPEAANAYGFTILFPLTFVSSAFVPVESMPSWLQPIAENNPFTTSRPSSGRWRIGRYRRWAGAGPTGAQVAAQAPDGRRALRQVGLAERRGYGSTRAIRASASSSRTSS